MPTTKTILVTGATGAQGGGVAAQLLRGGKFAVRCLTRNPNSEKARALARAGAEVVPGDLADPVSLRAALRDCTGAFGVTNFWEHFAKEVEHGKNLADAVKAAKVEHLIFSTLPSAKNLSHGVIEVPHLETKFAIEQYIRSLSIGASFVNVAFYFENFLTYFLPQKQADGSFAFGFPQGDTPLAAVAVEDVGGVVAAMFDQSGQFLGKTIGVVGDELPPQQYAETMSRVLGKKIVYNYIPREQYAALGFPGSKELADMFELFRVHTGSRQADIVQSRALYPKMQNFETWLRANKQRF